MSSAHPLAAAEPGGRRGPLRTLVLALLCFGVGLAAGRAATPSRAEAPRELATHEIRAAYLFNFTKFVTWPQSSGLATSDTLVIVVHDDFETWKVLEKMSRSATSGGRPLSVRHIRPGDSVPSCRVLYVAASDAGEAARVLQAPAARAALTVGNSETFLKLGGVIRLLEVRNRLVFDVSLPAAEQRRLEISSAMLKVAHAVLLPEGVALGEKP